MLTENEVGQLIEIKEIRELVKPIYEGFIKQEQQFERLSLHDFFSGLLMTRRWSPLRTKHWTIMALVSHRSVLSAAHRTFTSNWKNRFGFFRHTGHDPLHLLLRCERWAFWDPLKRSGCCYLGLAEPRVHHRWYPSLQSPKTPLSHWTTKTSKVDCAFCSRLD